MECIFAMPENVLYLKHTLKYTLESEKFHLPAGFVPPTPPGANSSCCGTTGGVG